MNQNMANLDPRSQEELKKLLAAETKRVGQENFDWQLQKGCAVAVLIGIILFIMAMAGVNSSYHPSTYITTDARAKPTIVPTPEPTPESSATMCWRSAPTSIQFPLCTIELRQMSCRFRSIFAHR